MEFHGPLGNVQSSGDLLIREVLKYASQHLLLTLAHVYWKDGCYAGFYQLLRARQQAIHELFADRYHQPEITRGSPTNHTLRRQHATSLLDRQTPIRRGLDLEAFGASRPVEKYKCFGKYAIHLVRYATRMSSLLTFHGYSSELLSQLGPPPTKRSAAVDPTLYLGIGHWAGGFSPIGQNVTKRFRALGFLWQSEHKKSLVVALPTARGHDGYILLSVLALVSDWDGGRRVL